MGYGRCDGFIESHGFSLIEAMIAMLILSVGCVAVIGMFVLADRAMARSVKQDQAVALARQLLEWKQQLPFDDLRLDDRDGDGRAESQMRQVTAGENQFAGEDDVGPFHRTWTVTYDRPGPGFATFSVNITWQERTGRSRQLAVGLIRADPRSGAV